MRWVILPLVLVLARQISAQDDVIEALEISETEHPVDKCLVKDYGAVGDGKTLDTVAIQNALDKCGAKEEGGVVEFEEGKTYLSGSLQIASKVTLSLPKKTVLKASTSRDHYPNNMKDWKFLRIDKVTRVVIEGPGEINGQAQQWTEKFEGKKELKSWYDEDCMMTACRPGLIGIRESSQITIQNIMLKDFVGTAVHIEKTDATAIIDTRIIADLSLAGPDGIVVDSGKRVYIGETEVQSPGFALQAQATSSKALESLLVDGVKFSSKSAAIQIGPAIKSEAKAVVIQNAEILESKRGISIQLYDTGSMKDVWFTNITVKASLSDNDAYGSGEAIFVAVKPEYYGALAGKMSGIWFGGIKAEVEGGVVFSGDSNSIIDGLTLTGSSISMVKSSNTEGGFRDYRPAESQDEDEFDIPIVFLEFANHVAINNTKVSFGSPRREEWNNLIQITPRSVHALDLGGLSMHDASAHASDSSLPVKRITQLGDFFRHSVKDFVNSIHKSGFISLQENAALGVQGKKAASSGGPIIMGLLFIVLSALGIRYLCIPAYQTLRQKRNR